MSSVQHITFQKEICPNTGGKHYQVYIQMKRKSRMSAVMKLLKINPDAWHAEVARGTPEEGMIYCSKDKTRAPGKTATSVGELSKQGERTDLHDYAAAIRRGASKRQLAETHPTQLLKYPRGTEALQAAVAKQRDSSYNNTVLCYVGGTGTGKTHKAHNDLRARFGDNYYVKDNRNTWWDGYEGQRGLLIDDYNGAWPIEYLLRVLHEHPERFEIKGSTVHVQFKFIIITSNLHPDEWYTKESLEHKAALKRRISRIVWMEQPWHTRVKEEPGIGHNAIEILDSDSE